MNRVQRYRLIAAALVAVALGLAVAVWFEFLHPRIYVAIFVPFVLAGGFLTNLLINYAQEQREQRRKYQDELQMLQAQRSDEREALDALALGLDVAVFMTDEKGEVRYANRRAHEMFRFQELNNKALVALTLSYDLESLALTAAKTNTSQTGELNFSYPEERVGLAKAWPRDGGKSVFISVYEITDLRRLERVRQDFVSNVSHEMRTPLTIIRALAESIQDSPDDEIEMRDKYLGKIIGETDRLTGLVEDLLTLSVAESNTVNLEDCDIAEIFRTTVRQLERKAEEKGLSLTCVGPAHIGLRANNNQMTQVAINLVANALNYTHTGEVKVTLESTEDQAIIKVSDTGIGISSENLSRIFERFYRVDKSRSRQTGGTGLGLSIVRHIVEAHGGKVSVESSLGHGSTFTVTLPLHQSK